MLLFGHVGITLGAAALLSGVLTTIQVQAEEKSEPLQQPRSLSHLLSTPIRTVSSWLTSLTGRIDVRLLLVGAMLPDIIDKPIGQFFFRDIFNNGRIFSHTLLFILVISIIGLFLYRKFNNSGLLVISFGSFMHLVLDEMWLTPSTLLWPLTGLSFERIDLTNWFNNLFHGLLNYPPLYISEIIGAVIIIWFALLLLRKGNLYTFIRGWPVKDV